MMTFLENDILLHRKSKTCQNTKENEAQQQEHTHSRRRRAKEETWQTVASDPGGDI
jgi:hypothetical protein